jgi:hypothetical protein
MKQCPVVASLSLKGMSAREIHDSEPFEAGVASFAFNPTLFECESHHSQAEKQLPLSMEWSSLQQSLL